MFLRRWLAARKVRRKYEKGCHKRGIEPYGDSPTGRAARVARAEGWVVTQEEVRTWPGIGYVWKLFPMMMDRRH